MRLKLAPKLLLINAGIILVLALSFVGLSYFFSKSMYSNALNGIDRDVLENFSDTLRNHYQENHSWDAYIDDRSRWLEAADNSFFTVFFSLMEKVSGNNSPGPPYSVGQESQQLAESPEWEFPFGTFAQRLSLLDAEKKTLIEAEIVNADASYKKIELEGSVIGWLRVGRINLDMLPLARYFFDQQLNIVYWSAAFGGIVAFILAFLLSRHITTPIKKLAAGAQQIARRDFKSRITINTGDELQDLSRSFNLLSQELDQYHIRQKQWLTNISHELRAPLTLLVGEIYSVCDNLSKCDERTAEFLQDQVMHVKRIADDLYLLSQQDEMGFHLNRQLIDLREFVAYQVKRFAGSFSTHNIAVSEDYLSTAVYVRVDADRFGQVLSNLFENCQRYIQPPGRLWISINANDEEVVLDIEDSGPGVPEENLSRVFDRHYRATDTNSMGVGGAGLGLAICKDIMEAHGGTIDASSSSKGGLCMRLRLPVLPEDRGEDRA